VKRYSVIIIVPLLIALVYAPLDVPYTLDSVVRVLPARQWVLSQATDGALSAVVYDQRTGLVRRQEGWQFDRGDLVQMRFQEEWKAGARVKAGETVATIASNRLSEQLIQLRNQLAVEQANLGVVASGQKPQVLAQLEEEIKLAQADVELRRKSLERTKQLQAEGLISALALEQAENALHDAQARVRLAEKSLAISASGEKQETVTVTAARIAALQKEIEFLENKRSKYVITAPFAGEVRLENTLEGDRLLVEDTTALILQIPVRLRDVQYLELKQQLTLQLPEQQNAVTATVLEIGKRVEVLGYEQVVLVKAVAAEADAGLLAPGAPVRCRVVCGKVRLAEFLRRSLRWQM
jgi:multidrug efflux pump subunit AcrA (membrane-fusion protein)